MKMDARTAETMCKRGRCGDSEIRRINAWNMYKSNVSHLSYVYQLEQFKRAIGTGNIISDQGYSLAKRMHFTYSPKGELVPITDYYHGPDATNR